MQIFSTPKKMSLKAVAKTTIITNSLKHKHEERAIDV